MFLYFTLPEHDPCNELILKSPKTLFLYMYKIIKCLTIQEIIFFVFVKNWSPYINNKTGPTSWTGTASPSGTCKFTPGFWWGSVDQSLVFWIVFYRSLLVPFLQVVCPSLIYCYWLPPLVSSNFSSQNKIGSEYIITVPGPLIL